MKYFILYLKTLLGIYLCPKENEQLQLILRAKSYYIKHRGKTGMCSSFKAAYNDMYQKNITFEDIKFIIPEFRSETFGLGPRRATWYWWSMDDIKSRVKAFNTLIKLYR